MCESKLEKDYSKSVKDLANRVEMITMNHPYFHWGSEVQGGAVDEDLIVDLLIELASRKEKCSKEEAYKSALAMSDYINTRLKNLCDCQEDINNLSYDNLKKNHPNMWKIMESL